VYFGDNLTFKTLKIPSETGDQNTIDNHKKEDVKVEDASSEV
jgi:hypothetical protein